MYLYLSIPPIAIITNSTIITKMLLYKVEKKLLTLELVVRYFRCKLCRRFRGLVAVPSVSDS